MADNHVEDFLSDIQNANPSHYQVLLAARRTFLTVENPLRESIKYGGLVYALDGELIGGIFVYKEHLSVEFSNGSQFDDPHTVLEGGGKYRRHIKLSEVNDIQLKQLAFYVEQALGKCQE